MILYMYAFYVYVCIGIQMCQPSRFTTQMAIAKVIAKELLYYVSWKIADAISDKLLIKHSLRHHTVYIKQIDAIRTS